MGVRRIEDYGRTRPVLLWTISFDNEMHTDAAYCCFFLKSVSALGRETLPTSLHSTLLLLTESTQCLSQPYFNRRLRKCIRFATVEHIRTYVYNLIHSFILSFSYWQLFAYVSFSFIHRIQFLMRTRRDRQRWEIALYIYLTSYSKALLVVYRSVGSFPSLSAKRHIFTLYMTNAFTE